VTGKQRVFLMAVRQGLLIMLGAIEDYLELPRTRIPKRKREDEPARNGLDGQHGQHGRNGRVTVLSAGNAR